MDDPRRQPRWYDYVAGIVVQAIFALWWAGLARFEPASIMTNTGQMQVVFAPIWHAAYWPVLALSAGIIAVNALKLAASRRERLTRLADLALQAGVLAFIAWAFGAPRWFTVTGAPPKTAASLQLGLTLGVQVTLIVMLFVAAISVVYGGWRLWRPAPPQSRALNGA